MSQAISSDCIFCKIVAGQIPSPRVYEDEKFICIRDIQPKAKTHLLVIPKRHVASLNEAFPKDQIGDVKLIGELFEAATQVAREQELLPDGFTSVINTGIRGGQTVFHLHLHLMA